MVLHACTSTPFGKPSRKSWVVHCGVKKCTLRCVRSSAQFFAGSMSQLVQQMLASMFKNAPARALCKSHKALQTLQTQAQACLLRAQSRSLCLQGDHGSMQECMANAEANEAVRFRSLLPPTSRNFASHESFRRWPWWPPRAGRQATGTGRQKGAQRVHAIWFRTHNSPTPKEAEEHGTNPQIHKHPHTHTHCTRHMRTDPRNQP